MKTTLRDLALLACLPFAAATTGCSTVAGTAVSPLTGGVDLCREALDTDEWYWAPFVWLGGTIGGPFVAFYNGINYDAQVFTLPLDAYWKGFHRIFRPWDMVL